MNDLYFKSQNIYTNFDAYPETLKDCPQKKNRIVAADIFL
jgi:hypothetical protein